MLIDISIPIDPNDEDLISGLDADLTDLIRNGHIGTHIDLKDKSFDLSNCIRNGRIFNATHVKDGEIEPDDLYGIEKIVKNDFVIIHTGWSNEEEYGTASYFDNHPELSMDLIGYFVSKGVSLIGIDGPGLKRGELHGKVDQYLADHGIFVVENLCNLKHVEGELFQTYCFPMNFVNVSGIPCRVIIETMPMSV